MLKKLISDNSTTTNTGFLLWIPGYCLSCIFQYNPKNKYKFACKYFVPEFTDSGDLNWLKVFFKDICSVNTLVQTFCNK